MGLGRLRRYDVQASYAVRLALLAVLPCLAALALAIKNYNADLGQIVYGSQGRFVIVYFSALALSMLPGAAGFFLGWSSAGQKRNDKSTRSWVGFFVGGTVLTFDVILLLAFLILRLKQPV